MWCSNLASRLPYEILNGPTHHYDTTEKFQVIYSIQNWEGKNNAPLQLKIQVSSKLLPHSTMDERDKLPTSS